jgi:SsrA-binding protein
LPDRKGVQADDEVSVVTTNRKAFHLYVVVERIEAGMSLVGTEVKSLRARLANLTDAYAAFENEELYLYKMHIGG